MIGRNIITLIDRKGITQKELAERCGCSMWSISRYVNGVHTPGMRIRKRLASVLGVTMDELCNKDLRRMTK